jgi:hypothetical protein
MVRYSLRATLPTNNGSDMRNVIAWLLVIFICAACSSGNTGIAAEAKEQAGAAKSDAQIVPRRVIKRLSPEALDAAVKILESSEDEERILATMKAQGLDAAALEDLLNTIALTARYIDVADGMQAAQRAGKLTAEQERKLARARDIAEQRLVKYFAARGGPEEMQATIGHVRGNIARVNRVFPQRDDTKRRQ